MDLRIAPLTKKRRANRLDRLFQLLGTTPNERDGRQTVEVDFGGDARSGSKPEIASGRYVLWVDR